MKACARLEREVTVKKRTKYDESTALTINGIGTQKPVSKLIVAWTRDAANATEVGVALGELLRLFRDNPRLSATHKEL